MAGSEILPQNSCHISCKMSLKKSQEKSTDELLWGAQGQDAILSNRCGVGRRHRRLLISLNKHRGSAFGRSEPCKEIWKSYARVPPEWHWVTNLLAYCELHCQEGGAVLVRILGLFFLGNSTRSLANSKLRRAKWGQMLNGGVSQFVPKCPVLSPFVLFCPSLGPGTGTNRDKRGQTGTKQDISGQIGKRPHLASTPI